MNDFLLKLLGSPDIPARWYCGTWPPFQGWLLIISDIAIFGAYAAIPAAIIYFAMTRRHELVFSHLYWLFATFILSCGLTHLIDAIIFWHPIYRVQALVKLITAISSWATVIVLLRIIPTALGLPGTVRLNRALQAEVEQHKRASDALRESGTQLSLALQHSSLGNFRWDAETMLMTLSSRAAEICGLAPEVPYSGNALIEMLHPEDQERIRANFRSSLAERTEYNVEYRVIRPNDGQMVWVNARGRGNYGEDGRVLAMLGVVQDITERKHIEGERERLLASEQAARAEAERASRMKDEFLANLSHELRTPLNAISGWTHLLKTETDQNERQHGLQIIEENARLQARLIEDLLDLNRIITGKIRLDVQIVDLNCVVQAALDGVRPSAESKQIELVSTLDAHAGPVVGDPSRLQQVVWNILTNAIKFTPRRGRVEVLLERVNSHTEISVRDSGVGIPPDFLPFVFDRFRQADATTTRRHGGLGLGLAIVKNLVELHGGTIQAESAGENQGATFRLALPLPAMKIEPSTFHRAAPEGAEVVFTEEAPDLALRRILLVDDEADSLSLLRRMLARRGAIVETASNGREALEKLQKQTFHAIISDIGMPEMDGLELIRKIRAMEPAGERIIAVTLTAYARPGDRQQALEAGFDAVLFKPVEPVDLLAALGRHLPKRVSTGE